MSVPCWNPLKGASSAHNGIGGSFILGWRRYVLYHSPLLHAAEEVLSVGYVVKVVPYGGEDELGSRHVTLFVHPKVYFRDQCGRHSYVHYLGIFLVSGFPGHSIVVIHLCCILKSSVPKN